MFEHQQTSVKNSKQLQIQPSVFISVPGRVKIECLRGGEIRSSIGGWSRQLHPLWLLWLLLQRCCWRGLSGDEYANNVVRILSSGKTKNSVAQICRMLYVRILSSAVSGFSTFLSLLCLTILLSAVLHHHHVCSIASFSHLLNCMNLSILLFFSDCCFLLWSAALHTI